MILEHEEQAKKMIEKLSSFAMSNMLHEAYFNADFRSKLVGVTLPDQVSRKISMTSGWARTVVESLHERVQFLGWDNDDLQTVYEENALDSESAQIHKDAFIYGCAYISCTAGDTSKGEPAVLVKGHDAKSTYGIVDHRTGRLSAAITKNVGSDGELESVDLWLDNKIVTLYLDRGEFVKEEIKYHGLGAVPMVKLVNSPRTGDKSGKSEITKSVTTAIDDCVRILVTQAVSREFYAMPQRYVIGLSANDFKDENGNIVDPFKILAGSIWGVPTYYEEDENGDIVEGTESKKPEVGQFDPVGTGPFIEQMNYLASQVAAETGLPADYLGVHTENPSSAESIRMRESRLIGRARERQGHFGKAWREIGRLALLILGEEEFSTPAPEWLDPGTSTLAAAADAAQKAIASGLFQPESGMVYKMFGMTSKEIADTKAENAMSRMMNPVSTIEKQRFISMEAQRAALSNKDSGENAVEISQ